jgi:hypothetical protein
MLAVLRTLLCLCLTSGERGGYGPGVSVGGGSSVSGGGGSGVFVGGAGAGPDSPPDRVVAVGSGG